jgi:hypothetical protein
MGRGAAPPVQRWNFPVPWELHLAALRIGVSAVQERPKEWRRFQAKSITGHVYTVIEWQRVSPTHANAAQGTEALGPKHLTLASGEPVTPRKAGGFEIARTGEVIREIG